MIALLIFSLIGTAIVWIAGRKDAALDPLLTTMVLGLLAVFPLLGTLLPKAGILPRSEALGDFPWAAMLGDVWLAGFILCAVRLGSAARGIAVWRKRSQRIAEMEGVEIRALEGLKGPVAAGIFRKMIFVPADWSKWDEKRRGIVLDHELAHHRRRDPLRRWIAGLAIAVNWFNPLVRWMVRRLLIQCEFACDAAVLKKGVAAKEYASLLCDLADETRLEGAALAMAEKQGLESRVRRMMQRHEDGAGMGASWLILLALASAALLAVIGSEKIAGYTKEEVKTRWSADPFPGR